MFRHDISIFLLQLICDIGGLLLWALQQRWIRALNGGCCCRAVRGRSWVETVDQTIGGASMEFTPGVSVRDVVIHRANFVR